ncbi:hypothetical protein P154DRAFT_32660 [Amniculicola lignicola CBS 123094]|uniref:Uncharacterized protein n=1 Tax=Amniculicola lignicola CBS 123094 TaxID=1392246 RepID=A0A6A5W087_9PLEO|nr:hypothetical protein P154DRAFT_32660 [Amniculicola lignicola CBS 123094]
MKPVHMIIRFPTKPERLHARPKRLRSTRPTKYSIIPLRLFNWHGARRTLRTIFSSFYLADSVLLLMIVSNDVEDGPSYAAWWQTTHTELRYMPQSTATGSLWGLRAHLQNWVSSGGEQYQSPPACSGQEPKAMNVDKQSHFFDERALPRSTHRETIQHHPGPLR